MRSRFGALTPLLGVLIMIAIGAAAYAAQASAEPLATSSEGSAEYRNEQFQFSLSYPTDMQVTATDEPGGAQTVSFMSKTTNKQFDILAIPYSQVDIAAGGYAPNNAYGTADQGLELRDVNVVTGGGVLQVWFVKTGVMYEVITMQGDEAWLIDILKTWQFD